LLNETKKKDGHVDTFKFYIVMSVLSRTRFSTMGRLWYVNII